MSIGWISIHGRRRAGGRIEPVQLAPLVLYSKSGGGDTSFGPPSDLSDKIYVSLKNPEGFGENRARSQSSRGAPMRNPIRVVGGPQAPFIHKFLCGFALASMAPACDRAPSIPAARIVDVRVGDITRGVIAVGRVEPRTRVEVKSKANGIIQKLLVDVSDEVAVGQVIAELDREILQARVAGAQGRLRQAEARVELAKAELKRLEITRQDPEFEYARRNWERVQELQGEGLASD